MILPEIKLKRKTILKFVYSCQIDHIDAVYERHDHRIVFFIGKFMYILNGNVNLDSHPVPLTQIGLPESLEKVDAVFRWGWNGKTYIFSGIFRSIKSIAEKFHISQRFKISREVVLAI